MNTNPFLKKDDTCFNKKYKIILNTWTSKYFLFETINTVKFQNGTHTWKKSWNKLFDNLIVVLRSYFGKVVCFY